MGRIISVVNHKGGVGKTTTAVNIAACLAETGNTVLLVDVDPQGSASMACGVVSDGKDLLSALQATWSLPTRRTAVEGLSIVPSGPGLALASERFSVTFGADLLSTSIQRTEGEWNWVIIDCPPSIGVLTQSALRASRDVIIPVEASHLSLKGLSQMVREVDSVRERNQHLDILAILPCRVHPRRRMHAEVMQRIEEMFPRKVAPPVRESVALAECPGVGLPITRYAPRSNGAHDYRNVAAWIKDRTRVKS